MLLLCVLELLMFSSLVHLILSLSISYPYLIKFHYFADNSQEGIKHQMRGATQAQQGHDFRDNFTMCIKYRVSAFHTELFKKIHYFVDTTERGVWG